MKRILTCILAAFFLESAYGALPVSTGEARRGEWNASVSAVLEAAREQHVPMMIVLDNEGCTHCMRLLNALEGIAFNLWRKDRSIFMVNAHNPFSSAGKKKYTPRLIVRQIPFFKKVRIDSVPMVYVYWSKADGTEEGCAFAGRRGAMGGQAHELFAMELMSAIDKALDGYLRQDAAKHLTLDEILSQGKPRKVSCKALSGGKVKITPEDGMLTEGKTVVLEALTSEDPVFIGWKNPSGDVVGRMPKLVVTGAMPDDSYVAEFRNRADILPPIVCPAETSICVRVGEVFKYGVAIDEKSQPVSFHFAGHLPIGIKPDPRSGVLSGKPRKRGTNIVDIVIHGNDSSRTVVTNRLTLIVQPMQRRVRR